MSYFFDSLYILYVIVLEVEVELEGYQCIGNGGQWIGYMEENIIYIMSIREINVISIIAHFHEFRSYIITDNTMKSFESSLYSFATCHAKSSRIVPIYINIKTGRVAQSAEHGANNARVVGSSPISTIGIFFPPSQEQY